MSEPLRGGEFNVVHISGLWNAPDSAWRAAIDAATKAASVVTFTETTSRDPRRDGWGVYGGEPRPGANEGTVMWDRNVWQQVGAGFSVPVSRTTFALGNGKPRPKVHLIGVTLRHVVTGRLATFTVVHAPSAVEGSRRLVQRVRRSVAYMEMLAGIRTVKRERRRKHPTAVFVLCGDVNLNLRLVWVRGFLRTNLPGLRSGWRKFPERGTHGRRVIDGLWHSRRLVVVRPTRILARVQGFDHALTVTRLGFAEGE